MRIPRYTRRVDSGGRIGFLGFGYSVGRHLAGEVVEVSVLGNLVEISHLGTVVATHVRRHPKGSSPKMVVELPTAHRPAGDHRHERHPGRRHPRPDELCRLELPGRQCLSATVGRGRHRAQRRADLPRRSTHQNPPDPPRPREGVRRLLTSEGPAARQRARGRGLGLSRRYRCQSVVPVPGLDTA